MEQLEQLVVQAQLGDGEAYSHIVDRFQAMALSYAYSILGDYELAEDVRQEAFISAYCDLLALRNPSAFPGWFRQIVRKHSVDLIRGARVLTVPIEGVGDIADQAGDPAQLLLAKESREQVLAAIGQLPEKEREVTRLFYIEHESMKEIGERTGVPTRTVKSRLHTARARLRQRMMEMVKSAVQKQSASGDKRIRNAATREAISQFDGELRGLEVSPSQARARRSTLLFAKGRLLRFSGRMDEAIATFRQGLEIPGMQRDALHRARFRTEIGLTRVQRGEYAEAAKDFSASKRALQDREADATLCADIANGLGMCAWGLGSYRKAGRFYEQAIAASQGEEACQVQEAEARNNLALLHWKAGELERALEAFREGLRVWKQLKNRFGQGLALMNMGIIEENLGRYAMARRHYERALAMAETLDFVQLQAASISNLGNLALIHGEWDRALTLAERATDLARGIEDRRSEAIALEVASLAHLGLGVRSDARKALGAARRIAKSIGDRERLFSLDLVEIEIDLAENQSRGIEEKLCAARERLTRRDYTAELPRLLRLWAEFRLVCGEAAKTRRAIEKAKRECERQKNKPEAKRVREIELRVREADGPQPTVEGETAVVLPILTDRG